MEAVYKIKANELDSFWIESIKNLFHDRNIIIKVSTDIDETEFSTMPPADEKQLPDNFAAGPEVKFSDDELRKQADKIIFKGSLFTDEN